MGAKWTAAAVPVLIFAASVLAREAVISEMDDELSIRFRFVTSDEQSNIYAVTEDGDLLYYRDEARDGTVQWAYEGIGQKIAAGWGDFRHVFAGGDGIIYAVVQNGDLLYFRDEARNGTAQWAYDGVGQKIGANWDNYLHLLSGGDGIIYAVASNGDLLYFRDEARDGTVQWAYDAIGQKIGVRWCSFLHLFSGGDGIIYAVAQNGDLLYYRDEARDGTWQWAYDGVGQKIGTGWDWFSTVFSGGNGVIYAITPDGSMRFYLEQARDGTARWSYGPDPISSGWLMTVKPLSVLEGYCTPLSVRPGEAIEFKVSGTCGYEVTYIRLKQQDDGSVGVPMAKTFGMDATTQSIPQEPWKKGCAWKTSFALDVPADWPSGIYAARCANSYGAAFYIVFIVRPGTNARGDFVVLANTNTWNAYNRWGGRSKYSDPPAALLSFERPNPATTPRDDGGLNHLTRAELWVLNWLEDSGYNVDVCCDYDFHRGIDDMESYKALILSTHPEYWTLGMLDNLEDYLDDGGNLVYMAGNGIFEKVVYADAGKSLILFPEGGSRENSFFRNLQPPRPERAILGVAYRGDNYLTFAPLQVLRADHRFFAGTGLGYGDLIGVNGINGGGASGWEMDTSIPGIAPDDEIVAAFGASDRGSPPANLQLLARGTNPCYGADVTYYETPAGGFVFAAGSLTFGGSLVVDSHLQQIVHNVLYECLSKP
jgi:hypothetical protein